MSNDPADKPVQDHAHTIDTRAQPGEPGTAAAARKLKNNQIDSTSNQLTDQSSGRDGSAEEAPRNPPDHPTTGEPS